MGFSDGIACKVLSIFLIVAGIALLIAGSVMVGLNKESVYTLSATGQQARHYFGGIALVVLGVGVFFAGFISLLCALQLGAFERFAR